MQYLVKECSGAHLLAKGYGDAGFPALKEQFTQEVEKAKLETTSGYPMRTVLPSKALVGFTEIRNESSSELTCEIASQKKEVIKAGMSALFACTTREIGDKEGLRIVGIGLTDKPLYQRHVTNWRVDDCGDRIDCAGHVQFSYMNNREWIQDGRDTVVSIKNADSKEVDEIVKTFNGYSDREHQTNLYHDPFYKKYCESDQTRRPSILLVTVNQKAIDTLPASSNGKS
ncbi:MAG: hypothetical protein JSR46_05855 [Verrucomicrobia bacterium]|nr:hypothetical protein [Verrucomicrobiota bacterium]